MSPDGAKSFDATGSSSVNGVPPPRSNRINMIDPAPNTMTTISANTIDSVP